ncbi:unnamed protein product [Ectocarpus fasciculatus]
MKSFAFFVALFAATDAWKTVEVPEPSFGSRFTSIKEEADRFSAACRDVLNGEGPTFTIDVSDHSLSDGVGSLNLEGRFQREVVDNVDCGVVYKFNECRGMPTSLWVSTTQDLGDDMTANLRADIDTDSKNAVIDCRVNSGRDSVAVDFDTADSTMGPLRITKHLDLNGRKVIVQPTVDVQGKTGEVVVAAELDGDITSAELTVNHAEDSAVLEVCHRLDDNNVISPKVDLKTGDIAVRLNRSLGDARAVKFTAQRENVDWEYLEGAWVVKGNVPLTSDGATGAISFKRSITL